ncbi:MAG: LysM peptidoglycan-binding domain-containing protein [Anaerohalosphaeraceae bacterium]|nr:LysM peptidoglycan-binding domain-containing protein [Anaerohalosphaeraceae bacterium]
MTADAKIGLLLALVFVVAITFVINGLPGFLSDDKPAEQTGPYIRHHRSAEPGVVGSSRTVIRERINYRSPSAAVIPADKSYQRYSRVLPQAQAVVEITKPDTAPSTTVVQIQKPVEQIEIAPVKIAPVQQKPRYYTVTSGDSLSGIAKKFYGPEAGNKLVNIEKIFKANRSILKAPDRIRIGQKLVVPPLAGEAVKAVDSKVLEMVETPVSPSEYKQYIVKENDSLWKIAKGRLGNGCRYLEILKINKSAISDSDRLTVGMKLNLPVK